MQKLIFCIVHGCQIRNQSVLYYLTFQIVQWADLFTRQIYRDMIIESLLYCQKNKGLEVYAYVIMKVHPQNWGICINDRE
jgi:putative transposase